MRNKAAIFLLISIGFCYAAEGPLAGLPSEPGTTVARITALNDNQWINLGQPASDPAYGRNWGRTWGMTQTAAPALGGGFFYGEGPHGMRSPNNSALYGDDLWFYDINQNRWICCYPGTDVAAFDRGVQNGRIRINEHGILTDSAGDAMAVATRIHAYGTQTFDPDSLRFAFLGENIHYQSGSTFSTKSTIWSQATANPYATKVFSPHFFNANTGKFERYAFSGESPAFSFASVFVYVPSIRKYVYIIENGDVWLYDLKERAWTHPAVPGAWEVGIEASVCYDSKRDRLYVGGASYNSITSPVDNFRALDIQTLSWIRLDPSGTFPEHFGSNVAMFNYDTENDRAIIMDRKDVYAYDPETNAWTSVAVPTTISNLFQGYNGSGGFYDPVLNAHFYHIATDGWTNGSMIVYRYKVKSSPTEPSLLRAADAAMLAAGPNPFNPVSHIFFTLPEASRMHLEVFGADGRLVRAIASGEFGPGSHHAFWDAKGAAAGVYVVRLTTEKQVLTCKSVLAK